MWLYGRRHRGAATAAGTTVVATDTVTRADSAASAGDTETGGFTWNARLGTWGVSSNKLYCPTPDGGGIQLLTIPAGISDGSVEAVFSGGTLGTDKPWLVFRLSDTSNYLLCSAQSTTTIEIYKVVAGAFTQLATGAYSWVGGEKVRVAFSGATLTAYVDDVQKASGSDAFNSSATNVGLGAGTNSPTLRYDNINVTVP